MESVYDDDEVRVCSTCETPRPVDEFQTNWYPARGRAYTRRQCKVCVQRRQDRWTSSHPDLKTWRRSHALKRYQMTLDDYDAMLAAQGGKCANLGCDRQDNPGRVFAVDHDHSCCPDKESCGNCVRGLLCKQCNSAEGLLRSNPDVAMGLAQYMLRHKR